MRHRAVVAAALLAGIFLQFGCGASERPNVVFLLVDALRRGHVGSYGYERNTTPFLDELTREGAVFERAVAQAPWTTPSMASIWTSRYPAQLGVGAAPLPNGIRSIIWLPPTGLGSDVPTLAQLLVDHGYATLAFVPNTLAGHKFGLLRGFQTVYERSYAPADQMLELAMFHLDEHLASVADAPGPFFLYLHFMDIHEPTNPPAPFDSMFPVTDGAPHSEEHFGWSFTEWGGHRKPGFESFRSHKLALYDGGLAFIDSQIRHLFELLEARGVLENSVFVIASDHGEEFWDHPEFAIKFENHSQGGGGGAHGHSMLGELLDVPLIFYGKGVPRARIARQVRNLDIMPTILGLVGIEDRSLRTEGVDLFSRQERAAKSDLLSFSEDMAFGYEAKALSDGRFKYLRYTGHPESPEFLFERSVDAEERQDLAQARPRLVSALRAVMEGIIEANGRGTGEPVSLDSEDLEQLRVLGYVD